MTKQRNFEWATVVYEHASYDVCVGMAVEEVDEIRPVDSEINICAVMEKGVIDWMLEHALMDIHARHADPVFRDMSKRELEIEEAGLTIEWEAS